MAVKIFFCYSHEDEALLDKLKSHLRPLEREGLINIYHDRDIKAGTEWEQEINKQLNNAQIILLLVSPDFMNSDYCYGIEMKRAMERHERGEARVIPIILRHVYWQSAPFAKYKALPTDGRPVTDRSWHNVDRAFFNVVEGIRDILSEIHIEKSLDKANELYQEEKYDAAIELYEKVLGLNPNNIEAYIGKGLSLRCLNQLEEALTAFDHAIHLNSKDAQVIELKGDVLSDLKYYDQALLAYEQAIQFDLDNEKLYVAKGNMLQKLNQYQEAIESYDKAIELKSNYIDAYVEKGKALNKIERYREAIRVFRQAINIENPLKLKRKTKHGEDGQLDITLPDLTRDLKGSTIPTHDVYEAYQQLERQKIKHPPQGTTLYTYTARSKIQSLKWSPDGKTLALSDFSELLLFDMTFERQEEKAYTLHPLTLPANMRPVSLIYDIAWSASSQFIALASFDGVSVWKIDSGKLVSHYGGHNDFLRSYGKVGSISWLPNDCIASLKEHGNYIHIWQAFTEKEIRRIGFRSYKYSDDVFSFFLPERHWHPAWSPDGKYVAVLAKGSTLQVLDAATGKMSLDFGYGCHNIIGWSYNGSYFASIWRKAVIKQDKFTGIKEEINVRGVATKETLISFDGHSASINAGVWSPIDTYIASTGEDNKVVQIWEATTGRRVFTYNGHENPITCLAWSPDGTSIASGDKNGTIYVWQVF